MELLHYQCHTRSHMSSVCITTLCRRHNCLRRRTTIYSRLVLSCYQFMRRLTRGHRRESSPHGRTKPTKMAVNGAFSFLGTRTGASWIRCGYTLCVSFVSMAPPNIHSNFLIIYAFCHRRDFLPPLDGRLGLRIAHVTHHGCHLLYSSAVLPYFDLDSVGADAGGRRGR